MAAVVPLLVLGAAPSLAQTTEAPGGSALTLGSQGGSGAFSTSPFGRGVSLPASTSGVHAFIFTLDGSKEVPPVATAGTGMARVLLNENTMTVTIAEGTYMSLNATATSAGIYGPASTSASGPLIASLSVSGGTSGTFSGTASLTAQQVQDMINGLTYVNVFSSVAILGEIRGQIACEASLPASSVVRNGLGVNPLGFAETSPAVIGSNWDTTVDIATPGAVASIVVLSVGGPTSGFVLSGNVNGELLALPSYLPFDIAVGVHSLPLPNACGLVGLTFASQAATFSPGNIQLQNAIDVTVGTF